MAAVAAVMLASPPTMAIDIDYPILLGSSESQSDDLRQFTKWVDVLDRIFVDHRSPENPCASEPGSGDCRVAEWQAFVAGLSNRSRQEQMIAVNAYLNRIAYIEDRQNYGVTDYWATPREFLVRGGDCEDFAIAKYASLRALGFSASQLRILVLQDETLKTPHAVLVVYVDGKVHMLDNQIKKVVDANSAQHYRPLFSLNERSWWMHKRAVPQTVQDVPAAQPAASNADHRR